MFAPEVKAARYIPDDIYAKYNKMDFRKHMSMLAKNKHNVDDWGGNVFRFNRWKAHLDNFNTGNNRMEPVRYMPPNYLDNVASNGGVYAPEFEPEDKPAPHFQRPPIRHRKKINRHLEMIKCFEINSGPLVPWHPLLRDRHKKF